MNKAYFPVAQKHGARHLLHQGCSDLGRRRLGK